MIVAIFIGKGILKATMKTFTLSYILALMTLLTGCQSFQFVDSPIPVTSERNHASPSFF